MSTLAIIHTKLQSIQNNHIIGVKNITLDSNLLKDDIIEEICNMKIDGLQVISLSKCAC